MTLHPNLLKVKLLNLIKLILEDVFPVESQNYTSKKTPSKSIMSRHH